MRGDLFFFLGIFVLIFIVWVSTGGPSRPISFAGPYLNPIQTTGSTATPYGDPTKFSSINSNVTVTPSSIKVAAGDSPTRGAVTLSRDSFGAQVSDPKSEYVIVNLSMASQATVSTAGWRLVSKESGRAALFPQGAEVPRSGKVNTLTPILLRPGDQAIVTSGRSPVGISFRENICTGYMEENQDFHPALSQNCPTPSQELARFYDGANDACVDYVRSIPYCGTETNSTQNVSSSCESFVEERLTYNGCVAGHANDTGFEASTWRIFLGSGSELWKKSGETIMLLDAQGRLIDSLSY